MSSYLVSLVFIVNCNNLLEQGVLKYMQPINMIMIYYWDKRNGCDWVHVL